ncbi:hypothetical protein F443_16057 [Phytophthora nicotianae P1569]|uniref:Uncharacterized protein n=1 Tax=Phytophthora nicotianae P1569 TaxID=1317065 RepID=V9EFW9_PHYNI|nr:hypothetical protein F443_16057 [Phytophthora nicotianae P1569]
MDGTEAHVAMVDERDQEDRNADGGNQTEYG